MITGTLNPEFYLKNQQYFNDRLIEVLANLKRANNKLKFQIEAYEVNKQKDRKKITELQFKLKDTLAKFATLKAKCRNSEEERDEMHALVMSISEYLNKEMEELRERNNELEEENAQLKEELKIYKGFSNFKADSTNSSVPPSQDEFRETGSKKPKSERKVGGQPGHNGHKKKMTDKPDKVIRRTVKKAPTGAEKRIDEEGNVYYVTQEISSSLVTTVTETHYYIDEENGEDLPDSVISQFKINSVVFDDSVRSLALYLNLKGAVAYERLSVMLNEMSDGKLDIKPSTMVKWLGNFSGASAEEIENIKSELLSSPILFVDESGWKVNGRQEWIHAVTNGRVTLYYATDSRSGEDGPIGFLQDYSGILMHDHFKPYYTHLPETITHAECNEHVERYLKRGIDEYDSVKCIQMKALLKECRKRKEQLQEEGCAELPEEELSAFTDRYRQILASGLEEYAEEHPGISANEEAKYIKLFRRMLEYEDQHLRFLTDFNVPYTNNLAERCIRPMKAKKKISGQSKNLGTAQDFANAMTIIQSANWSGENTLEKMRSIMKRS